MDSKKITVTGVNIIFFVFAVLFIIFQIILGILTAVFGENLINNNVYRILLVNEYIIILIPVIIYTLAKRLNIRETFRFHRLKLRPMLLIIAISAPAYAVALMLNNIDVYILQKIGDIPNQPIPIPENISELIVGILIVAVSPAICEELLHRGLILRAYERRGSLKAVVISSIFFGLFHFDITNLLGPIFLGLLIGYFVIKTNSILAGMLAHFLNNTIAEVSQFIFSRNEPVGKIVQQITIKDLGGLIFIGIVALAIVAGLITVFKRVTDKGSRMELSISSVGKDVVSVISHWPIIVVSALYLLMALLFIITIVFTRINGI